MESFGLQQITHRRDLIVITKVLNKFSPSDKNKQIKGMLKILERNKINSDSVTIVNNDISYVMVMVAKKDISKNAKIELVQFGSSLQFDYSLLRIKGTGTRGVSGLAAKILEEFSIKKINIEILLSGTTEYDFYIYKKEFDKAFSSVLQTLNLPGISFV